MVSVKQY